MLRALFALILLCGSVLPVSAEDAPIAAIGEQPIARAELDARTAAKLAEFQSRYDSQSRNLATTFAREKQDFVLREAQALVDEKVLALEGKKRKRTPAELKAGVVPAPVTDEKARAFYADNKNSIGQPYEQVAPMIKQYLTKQAAEAAQRNYLATLRAKYEARVSIEPHREQVAATGPQRGPSSAPVTIVEFSDFECPFCARMEPEMRTLLARYPTKIRILYRNLPLTSMHPNAQRAAEAGICADEQGKFWELHDLMFAEQNSLDAAGLKDKAKRAGLDTAAFDACVASDMAARVVKADTQAADELGLGSTPVSFINGRYVNGAVSADELAAIIDDELQRVALTARR